MRTYTENIKLCLDHGLMNDLNEMASSTGWNKTAILRASLRRFIREVNASDILSVLCQFNAGQTRSKEIA